MGSGEDGALKTKDDQRSADVVWERAERPRRPAPVPLTRDEIVRAAMRLADKEGLDGVSLRNVGSALNAGPMRLYGFVATKDELLELMVDRVFGEVIAEGPLPQRGWRKTLREIAHRTRRAWRQHGWFVVLMAGRYSVGPNALAYLEASLAAVSLEKGLKRIDDAVEALRVLNAYVIGAIQTEAGELRAEKKSGLNEAQWRDRHYPYLQRMLATGRFPMVEKLVLNAADVSADVAFERGVERVLDGIAAHMAGRGSNQS